MPNNKIKTFFLLSTLAFIISCSNDGYQKRIISESKIIKKSGTGETIKMNIKEKPDQKFIKDGVFNNENETFNSRIIVNRDLEEIKYKENEINNTKAMGSYEVVSEKPIIMPTIDRIITKENSLIEEIESHENKELKKKPEKTDNDTQANESKVINSSNGTVVTEMNKETWRQKNNTLETNSEAFKAALKMFSKPDNRLKLKSKKSSSQKENEQLKKIALLLPLKGKNKKLGNNVLRGIEMGLFRSKIRNFQVHIFDTSEDLEKTIQKMGFDFDLILGPLFSYELKIVKRYFEDYDTPILSFSNDSRQKDENVWLLGKLPENEIKRIVRFGINTGLRKMAILSEENEYGRLLSKVAIKELEKTGGSVATVFLAKSDLNNINDLRNTIKDFSGWKKINENNIILPKPKYDGILLLGNSSFVLKVAPLLSYYDIGPDRIMIMSTSMAIKKSIAKEPSLEGSFISSTDIILKESFDTKWQKVWGGDAPNLSALGFDAGYLISNTFNKNTIDYVTDKEGHDLVTGKTWFKENGLNIRELLVYRVQDGEFVEVLSE